MDRHKLWRRVAYDYEQVKEIAPEGYEPVVEVFLVGRAEPVELGFVETTRSCEAIAAEIFTTVPPIGADLDLQAWSPLSRGRRFQTERVAVARSYPVGRQRGYMAYHGSCVTRARWRPSAPIT